jgi:hypothetical protein
MSTRPKRRLLAWMLLVAAVAVAVALFSVPRAAATGPAPGTGITGACNMANAWGVGAQGGMAHGMTVDNQNGNAGMAVAVASSGC